MLKIGVSTEIITPEEGTLLAGYPSIRKSKIINDDLTVSAICFSDGEQTAIMISACIVSVNENIVSRVKKLVKEIKGIENVTMSATHTHSGPVVRSTPGWGEADENYISKILIPKTVKACIDASESMRDGLVGIGVTESDVGINRREIKEDGTVKLGFNPWGLVDKKMYVIAFKEPNGKPICNMIHYGCHGTAAPGFVWDSPVTRDWSGVMTDRLETYTDAPTVFFDGAEGDIAPRTMFHYDKNKLPQMMELGGKAGLDAINAYNNIREYRELELNIKKDIISLDYEEPMSKEAALQRLEELADKDDQMWDLEKSALKKVVDFHDGKYKRDDSFTYEQIIISLGEIAFVPYPFELFTEISMRLQKFSPFGYTLTLSNTNESYGYLPNETDIVRGGYEIWSFRNRGILSLAQNSDTKTINENLRILREMKGEIKNGK